MLSVSKGGQPAAALPPAFPPPPTAEHAPPTIHVDLLTGVLIAAIPFGSPLPALLEADQTGEIKVSAADLEAWR